MPYTIEDIMRVLPHRYPMLLADRIIELEPGKRCRGYKNVTINEAFFQGHYPGNPIMPGVLIVESMAQVGSIILLANEAYHDHLPVLVGFENVKFRRPVKPGDQLMSEVEMLWFKAGIGKVKAVATVDGEIAAIAEILFKILKREEV